MVIMEFLVYLRIGGSEGQYSAVEEIVELCDCISRPPQNAYDLEQVKEMLL